MSDPDRKAEPPLSRALTIAGSDSGGGAGIQADLKTFSVLGVYGMSAITAVTVQNTLGVGSVVEVPPQEVAGQIRAVVDDIGVDAAKTGMLANADIVRAVSIEVLRAGLRNLVVDPVFVSKHGHALLAPDAVGALKKDLLPLASVVTPNLPEAEGLSGIPVTSRDDMRKAAEEILRLGAGAVLVKGGHLIGDENAADLLADGQEERWIESPRVRTSNTHGTGCTLSAAIAAHLACGAGLFEAVSEAKAFVTEAIKGSLSLGKGIGPVDQLWSVRAARGTR